MYQNICLLFLKRLSQTHRHKQKAKETNEEKRHTKETKEEKEKENVIALFKQQKVDSCFSTKKGAVILDLKV